MKIFVIAGEASGDVLGGKLIAALKQANSDLEIQGIGGERMQAQNIDSLFPMAELSIMGFVELIPHIPNVMKRINQTVEYIMQNDFDAVVTIDSPGFCCRVVKKLKELGYQGKLIHYVAPTVWAYKPERAKKMADLFDKLLVILPFEPPYFHKEGLKCDYVGHPIVEDASGEAHQDFQKLHNIKEDSTVICMMTGSRKGEVNRLFPIMSQTIKILQEQITSLHIIMPTVPHIKELLETKVKALNVPVTIIADYKEKVSAYKASNVALVKSGTSALEVSLAGIPIVVTYKINPISAYMLRKMLQVDYVNLINIMQNKEIIPELLQEKCNPQALSKAILGLLQAENSNQQLDVCKQVFQEFGIGDKETPSMKAAKSILAEL